MAAIEEDAVAGVRESGETGSEAEEEEIEVGSVKASEYKEEDEDENEEEDEGVGGVRVGGIAKESMGRQVEAAEMIPEGREESWLECGGGGR